ncbi:hypothetical protein NDU88_002681 [Pleurodeles waltl]|uniref:Uncharacterized protein n=1 Tax=Pleurodeles waltl TaxID=8319 RepID=A0AAV7NH47_PLEWA|nr:hypothetical protein NDU88_002681 [Pleurodeles waltl]
MVESTLEPEGVVGFGNLDTSAPVSSQRTYDNAREELDTVDGDSGNEQGLNRMWGPEGSAKRISLDDNDEQDSTEDRINNKTSQRPVDQSACLKKEDAPLLIVIFMGLYLYCC